jgi:hypothetical protein
MNTLRVCATVGLGLSLALGCSSSSNSGKDASAGGRRDAARSDTRAPGPDTPPVYCGFDGTSYPVGQNWVSNCVTYFCTSVGTVVQVGGSPCDAGAADLPANRDTATPAEVGRPVDVGALIDVAAPDVAAPDVAATKDVQPSEAGSVKSDVGGSKDVYAPDLVTPVDTARPVDVAPSGDTTTPDVASSNDTAVPLTCTSASGQKYYAGGGVCFPCASKMCLCDSNGVIVADTSGSCSVDAQ